MISRARTILPILTALVATLLLLPMSAWAEAEASAMERSLKAFFAAGVHHQGATAELIGVSRWPATSGAVRWQLTKLNRHTARLSLIAEQGSGQQLRRWYVPVRVHWWADAVVVKHETPIRSMLLQDMLTVQRVDVAGHVGVWWSKPSELVGMQVMRPLHKGDVVYSTAVKQPPLIKRGDSVTIVARVGSIAVRAEGKALKSGSRGDRLLVQNLRSKETMQGIVMDAGIVEVQTGGAG